MEGAEAMTMTEAQIAWIVAAYALVGGLWVGALLADRRWRKRGDHDYRNRMESGGHLYQVKRER